MEKPTRAFRSSDRRIAGVLSDRDAEKRKTIFSRKDAANGRRSIRARADARDDAHEADAARRRRRDPSEGARDALRQPATPHRCVSRRKRRPRPEQRRVHFFAPKRGEETRVAPPFGGGGRARAPRTRSARTSPRTRRPRAPPRAVTRANEPQRSPLRAAWHRGKISSLSGKSRESDSAASRLRPSKGPRLMTDGAFVRSRFFETSTLRVVFFLFSFHSLKRVATSATDDTTPDDPRRPPTTPDDSRRLPTRRLYP